ncbi:uncharacterized protein LOC113291745 [Papaver somniferum]|uniref:uncharacterized protein LOC113291745 n=1 Tax=Papaver somniferum TaxID=3469 RepID=UPI000E6FE333|nr:uncharacterized protein LOC113291745 [Papaver somniferum]
METYEITSNNCSSSSSSSNNNSFYSSDDDAVAIHQNNMAISLVLLVTNSRCPQTRIKLWRNRNEGAELLWRDYFCPNPTFPPNVFRRRFRMRRQLFNRIVTDVVGVNRYFVQKIDACGVMGLNPHQKVTAAIRMLSYGCAADVLDEYLCIGETTVLEATRWFCITVVHLYGKEYLSKPTASDVELLLNQNRSRGFLGMMGSIDCMHWKWDKCPSAESGAYTSYKGSESIVLEAVSCHGKTPPVDFVVNGHSYDMSYYLGDGIYPEIATIIMSIKHPEGKKKRKLSGMQEVMSAI